MNDAEILAAFKDTAVTATRHITEALDKKSPLHGELPERRRLATGAFQQARQTAILAAAKLRHARLEEARIEFANDPKNDAARTSDLLEADQLSRGMGKVEATNKLLPAGWDSIRLHQIRSAEVFLRAAKLAGAVDTALAAAIEEVKNLEFPNRSAALQKGADAVDSHENALMEIQKATANFSYLIGDGPATAQASLDVKMRDWSSAQAEGRPVKGERDLGLPDTSRPEPDWTNVQLGRQPVREVQERH
jgi:hypothetical protein